MSPALCHECWQPFCAHGTARMRERLDIERAKLKALDKACRDRLTEVPPPQPALDRLARDADASEVRATEWRERAGRAEEEARALRLEVAALRETVGELLWLRDENERVVRMVTEALATFDSLGPDRGLVIALDLVAEVRYALGGHHVAYPENEGDGRFDRSAWFGSPWERP